MSELEIDRHGDQEIDEENYKAPPQKTIEELLKLDNEDESLRKYKEALLGAQAEKIIIDGNNPKNVIVKRLSLMVQDRPDMILELDGNLSKLKKQTFVIKEGWFSSKFTVKVNVNQIFKFNLGIQYKIKIEFYVQREIVHGLKYIQKTSRLGVTVDKMIHMVGSYPPKAKIQSFTTNFEGAPSGEKYAFKKICLQLICFYFLGMLARGEYYVSSLFTDDDSNEHLKWEWSLTVSKDW